MLKNKYDSEKCIGILITLLGLAVPFFVSTYKLSLFSYFLFGIILCCSVVLVWGYGGSFSFGQAAFYGAGAYLYGIISGNMNIQVLTPVAALLSIIAVGLFALIIGYFLYYGGVNDLFAGIITLCITLALNNFLAQTGGSQWKVGKIALGGYNGMTNISALYIGNLKLSGLYLYYVTMAIVVLMVFGLLYLRHSRLGYTLAAIRENRGRSSLFGYNVALIQTINLGVSGAIAALGGVLYASWGNYIAPSSMDMTSATIPVILVATGGKKSPVAAVLCAFIYYYATNALAATGNEYANIILGVVLVLVITLLPKGLFKAMFDVIDEFVQKLTSESASPTKGCDGK